MDVQFALGTASGVLIALVGVGLILTRPRRLGGWFFAAFCALWGLEIAANNIAQLVTDPATEETLSRVAMALLIPETLLLVHFAVRFPGVPKGREATISWVASGLAVVAAVLFAFDPAGFVRVETTAEGTVTRTGAAGALLVNAPAFGALYLATFLLLRRYRETAGSLVGREVAITLAALGLYLGYSTPFYLLFYPLNYADQVAMNGPVVVWTYIAVFAAGAVTLAYALVSLWRRGVRSVAAAIGGAAALGILSGLPLLFGGSPYYVFSIPRIFAAGLIAYGIVKNQLFGIDLKMKSAIRKGTIATAFFVVFLAGEEAAEEFIASATGSAFVGIGAAAALGLVLSPLRRFAGDVSDKALPGVQQSEDYFRRRRLEVYRGALEGVLLDRVVTPKEKRVLARLREDLGITAQEAYDVEREVSRSLGRSALVTREALAVA